MKILFFCDNTHNTAAVSDHIKAITQASCHEWYVENPLSCKVLHKLDFSMFDAVGFHYSIRPNKVYYCSTALFRKVQEFQGIKFQFLQDENYRVNDMMESMVQLGIDVLFTIVRPELVRKAYPDPRLKNTTFITVLTGYVPDNLHHLVTPPIAERTTDIFYRSRTCPYWLGKLAQEKVIIATEVEKLAKQYNLTVDLSVREEDRVYGAEWVRRLSSAKAVLGTESGTSIWDFTGDMEKLTNHYLSKNPHASFEDVSQKILAPYESNILYSALSPRIFEAAALKTPMIMFPGWYSGVCKAGEHYIVLEKDFSNFADVVKQLQDVYGLQQLADRTYVDLIESGKYDQKVLAVTVDEAFTSLVKSKSQVNLIHREEVVNMVQQTKANYALTNSFFWGLSELRFVFSNFFRILFDRTHPISQKAGRLYQGAARYLLYLKPRIKNVS